MHSPTLIILASILAALITAVLYVVLHFNKSIPGLRWWTLGLLTVSAHTASGLVRAHIPEVLSVALTQSFVPLIAYFFFIGSRAYMGRPPVPHWHAAAAIAAVVATAEYFTVVQPNLGIRFFLLGLLSGGYFLRTALTLAQGGFRNGQERYLIAILVGLHGCFVLLRPLLFKIAAPIDEMHANDGELALISQFVAVEGVVALVMSGFSILMLTNEYITRELRHLAEIDPLTNVFNRRAFLTLLDKAISNAQRTKAELSVLVIDLDHFKKINDTWGHQGGDDVLRHFVALATGCLRNEDVMGRLGGEEFAIFLPNASRDGTTAVAERLRFLVATHPAVTDRGAIDFTVSIGATRCLHGDTSDSFLHRADEAMYLAKERGRNRVEVQAHFLPVQSVS